MDNESNDLNDDNDNDNDINKKPTHGWLEETAEKSRLDLHVQVCLLRKSQSNEMQTSFSGPFLSSCFTNFKIDSRDFDLQYFSFPHSGNTYNYKKFSQWTKLVIQFCKWIKECIHVCVLFFCCTE